MPKINTGSALFVSFRQIHISGDLALEASFDLEVLRIKSMTMRAMPTKYSFHSNNILDQFGTMKCRFCLKLDCDAGTSAIVIVDGRYHVENNELLFVSGSVIH